MVNLQAAGVNETEAKAYQALLTRKEWLPSELAKNVSETRTNMYKILDKLVDLGLAERFDKNKKLHYRATNPAHLLELAHDFRTQREKAEKELALNAQSLTTEFIKTFEQPAIRFYQGKEEISEIFKAIAASQEPALFINTLAGIDFYGYNFMHNLRMLAVDAGVKRFALTPDTSLISNDYKENDKKYLLKRTWLKDTDYTAPVEWGVFEDKIYIISYGEEALGMIIESPQIALAFKQIYSLLERGQHSQSWYSSLPQLATKNVKQ